MNPIPSKYIRTMAPALTSVLLLACQGDSSVGESSVQMSPGQISVPVPSNLRQTAALRASELSLQISINDEAQPRIPVSGPIDSTNPADNAQDVTVLVPEGQINNIKIEWFMNVRGQSILLADFSANVRPEQTLLEVLTYNTRDAPRFDIDRDGFSNLQEAEENRNLLSEFDAEVPFRTVFSGAPITVLDDGIDNDTSGDVVDPDPLDTTFGLRHDGTDLIVYVCGQDDILVEDSRAVEINGQVLDQYWHDDTVYIYLDGRNSDNDAISGYDRIDDFQLAFIRGSGEMRVVKGGDGDPATQFCPSGSCITDYKFFNNSSACEYEFDVRLPLAELNMNHGDAIGFDLEFTDDDNGDLRDGSRGWIGFKDASDEDPSTFGTIMLR